MMDVVERVAVLLLAAGSGLVAFLFVTRRGWWATGDGGTDWLRLEGCVRCWEHGPFPGWDRTSEVSRDAHRGVHEIVVVVVGLVGRLLW